MRRVLVIGPPGSGKTTFALALGARTGLPVVHLDAEYWKPGWEMPDSASWRTRVGELVERDAWIMDGNYDRSLDLCLRRADTLFRFDTGRLRCLRRVLWRVARGYGTVRPDMAAGCPERIDLDFLRYIWHFPDVHGPRSAATVAALGQHVDKIIIRSDRQARAVLASIDQRSVHA
jgi:adenylate kinase family enzyme